MDKKQQQLLQWQLQLESDEPLLISGTLQNIENDGFAEVMPILLDFLQKNKYPFLQERAGLILNHLKNEAAFRYILDALEEEKYQNIYPQLLTALWMNATFPIGKTMVRVLELITSEDPKIAFEAFLTLENLVLVDPIWLAAGYKKAQMLAQEKKNLLMDKAQLILEKMIEKAQENTSENL